MTDAHAAAVLAIYQAGIDEGNATFETSAPGWEAFTAARLPGHRYVAVTGTGCRAGWPRHRCPARPVYPGVVEHSVYVHPAARGQGIGRALAGGADRLHRGGRDLDHPVEHLPGECRQRRPAPGRRVPRRGHPGTDRPAPRPLARHRAHRAPQPGPVTRRRAPGGQEVAARRGARRSTRRLSSARAASKLAGIAGRDRVGDGPVHRRGPAEFLVGHVADGDDQVAVVPDLADVAGPQPGQRQAVAPGGGDRAGIDPRGGVGPGRYGRDGAGPAPQRRGQVRAGRVGGAHEQHPPRGAAGRGGQRVQRAGDQLQVGAAAVALGPAPGDDPGLLQHVQVVGEQVGRHGQHGGQLGRRRVPGQQGVGDLQPRRVGQRRVHSRPPGQIRGSLSSH